MLYIRANCEALQLIFNKCFIQICQIRGKLRPQGLRFSSSLILKCNPLNQGWASNFGRSLLDLDIFRDRVVLEYLTIEYPTRHFADALDRSSFTRFHLIFRVKWKSRVKLDFTRYYSACSTIEFRGQVHSTIKYSNPTFFQTLPTRLPDPTRLDPTRFLGHQSISPMAGNYASSLKEPVLI